MTIRYIPGYRNIVADSLSRGAVQVSSNDFQEEAALDDPDIGIGIAALFTTPQEVKKEWNQKQEVKTRQNKKQEVKTKRNRKQ